jgi:hypothetical protein
MFKLLTNIKNKGEAQGHAINWQNWQSTQALSWGEVLTYQNHFAKIGKRFNLTREFKENGII